LEDLVITKAAYETKLRIIKFNEVDALQIRKRLSDELWPKALTEYEQLKQLQTQLQPVVRKATELKNEMSALILQHNRLMCGDKLWNPPLEIPPEFYVAAEAKLTDPPKLFDTRLSTDRERDHITEQLKKQKPIVSKILSIVKIDWPVCPICETELLAQMRRFELAPDQSKGYVEMSCTKHSDQWISVTIPARPALSAAGHLIPTKGPLALGDIVGSVPYKSHGLAEMPGLTKSKHQGGKRDE